MYNDKKVSVVISTYQEKDSIRTIIEQSFDTGFVDEVIVINNNAEPGTDEEIKKTNAILIHEERQGYGWGYRRGLQEATGDLIIMTEADGTFTPNDFKKLLVFSEDTPVVFGTRTATHKILSGANMGLFLKWGNWAVAKMVEVLFSATQLSDVGCTTRLVRRDVLDKIQPYFTVGTSHFGLEMMLLIIGLRIPFVEIPVHYKERIGESAVTGSFIKTWQLGLTMIAFLFKMKFKNPYLKKNFCSKFLAAPIEEEAK